MNAPPSEARIADSVVEASLDAWAEVGRHSEVPIHGTSMLPLLVPGDLVLIDHGHQRLRVGDILAFHAEDRVVIHRLLRRSGSTGLLTGGDNRRRLDEPTSADRVLGKVVAVMVQGRQVRLDTGFARALGWGMAASLWTRRHSRTWHVVSRVVRWTARLIRP